LLKKGKIGAGSAAEEETAGTDESNIQGKGDSENDKRHCNVIKGGKTINGLND